MNLRQVLFEARESFTSVNIENALLESEILLMHALKIDRISMYTDIDYQITSEQYAVFREFVRRRLKGEPSAYITGNREFYGLDFHVNTSVLIPRQETELLVETSISLAKKHSYKKIADIGTGSGCIAVCLALNLPGVKIYAADISVPALDTALQNCRRHGVEDSIILLKGDMLAPLPEPVDMIVANLPYIIHSEVKQVNTAGYEPEIALDGGDDGLRCIISLCRESTGKLSQGGSILLEVGQKQAEIAAEQLKTNYPDGEIEILPDLAGIERVVRLTLSQSTR